MRCALVTIVALLLACCGSESASDDLTNAPVLAGRTFTCLVSSIGVAHIQADDAAPVGFRAHRRVTIEFTQDGTFRYAWTDSTGGGREVGSLRGRWRPWGSWGGGTVRFWMLSEGDKPMPPPPDPGGGLVPWPHAKWMKKHRQWTVPAVDFATGAFLADQAWPISFLETSD